MKKKEKNGLAILERDNTNQFFFLVSTFDIFFRSHQRSFEPEQRSSELNKFFFEFGIFGWMRIGIQYIRAQNKKETYLIFQLSKKKKKHPGSELVGIVELCYIYTYLQVRRKTKKCIGKRSHNDYFQKMRNAFIFRFSISFSIAIEIRMCRSSLFVHHSVMCIVILLHAVSLNVRRSRSRKCGSNSRPRLS